LWEVLFLVEVLLAVHSSAGEHVADHLADLWSSLSTY
jgi:hypothetical protein